MKKRKFIFVIGALLAGGMFVLLQGSPEDKAFQDEIGGKSSDEEKKDASIIFDNNIREQTEEEYTTNKSLSDLGSEDIIEREEEEYRLYMEFLSGEIAAGGNSIDEIIRPTGEPERRYFTEYTFFDSDQDGFQELHVRSARYYYIIDCEKGMLSTWKFLDPRTELLNNGDFLYHRSGGAPPHEDYEYIKVNMEGETVWSIWFACYDDNVDGQFDERDKYYGEKGEELSYDEWLELKQKYLDVGIDEICWITLTESI